jgi:hypothetical protein
VRVVYTPEGGAEQTWVFKPGRVRQSQAAITEKAYGKPWDMFVMEVQQGSMAARRILLWHVMRTEHPMLRLDDVPDFFADELRIEHDAEELRALLEATEKNVDSLPAEQRDVALMMLRSELIAAEESEHDAGKATSNSAA